jgi:hypothetical protein
MAASGHPLGWIGSAYARLQWLSIDVAVGALGGGLLAQRICGVQPHLSWYVVLPLSVWVIYTLDHLLDARRLGMQAHTARHIFHHRFAKQLGAAMALVAMLALALAIWGLGGRGLAFGAGMAAFTGGHLLFVRLAGDRVAPWLLKELGVGLVYTFGIWGWPLVLAGRWPDLSVGLPLLQFFALVMANLLTFSWYEQETDATDGHTSFVRAIGGKRAVLVIKVLVVAAGLLGPIALAGGADLDIHGQVIFSLMALMTASLLQWPAWMMRHERYRLVGDGAFLLPFLSVYSLLS